MAFLIPPIQFFFVLPRVLFCFGIHFNAILSYLLPFFALQLIKRVYFVTVFSSCSGYRVSFTGVKRPGLAVDHSHPHLAPTLRKEYSHISTPPLGLHGLFEGELCFFLHLPFYLHLVGGTLLVAQLVEALRYKSEGRGFDY